MIRRLLLAIIVLVAAPPVCGGGAAALAHAVVVETVPADGAVLDAPPGTVVIRFSEPVTPIAVRVLDGAGRAMTAPEAATARDREVRIALPPDLPRGSYIASYRVTSLDSHPIGGSIVFAVGAPSATGPTDRAGEADDDAGWRAALLAARLVLYAGLLGGAGGVLCRLLVRPPAADGAGAPGRATAGLAAAGAVAALLSIGLEGGLLTGAPA
ncbi:MAG TPA: copper resistance CopC family protein, partial [Geminicoccaceae bacterium]|nr:copper resistance CopC family protein [Geminicoccaceae bacterium]